MNKIYSLLGIGLLGAATLSSCKEDIFTEEQGRAQQGKLQTYTAVASINSYKNTEKVPSSRANVQDDGSSFMWNKDDKVTIWNGTNGYEFSSVNYDESEPSGNVEFTGDGALADGATVWGIYPKKDSPTTANVFTFTLEDNVTQSGDKPELQNTMHMLAKGTVNGNTVTNLNFEHLTALFQFSIKNLRPDSYKITSATVSCETAIFPKTLIVSDEEKTYGDKVKSLTLNLTDLTIAKGATSHGYINFFPMPDMTGDTELTFSITIQKAGDGSPASEIVAKEVKKVSELYKPESVVAGDGYKYVAGKRYGVMFSLFAELGYEETGTNQYLVKKEEGLINLASDLAVMTNTETVITLDTDLDFQAKDDWEPIADFKGILDGNGHKISNLNIVNSGENAGFFITNSGTIKNLTLGNVTIEQVAGITGAFAATNAGTIQNCIVDGGTLAVNGADALIGGITGFNSGSSVVEDCQVKGSVELTVAGGKVNGGALVGKNGNWSKARITGCSVDKEVSFVYRGNGTGAVGGLVGWNVQATISGCSCAATIKAYTAGNIGALVGGNGGTVLASYAAGEISAKYSNIAGLAKDGGTLTGCYTTAILPVDASNKVYGVSAGAVTATECYFMIDGVTNAGGGIKVDDAAGLVAKKSAMNAVVVESGFEFVENNGVDKDKVPLLIQKKRN